MAFIDHSRRHDKGGAHKEVGQLSDPGRSGGGQLQKVFNELDEHACHRSDGKGD